jgi:hypothetical protein
MPYIQQPAQVVQELIQLTPESQVEEKPDVQPKNEDASDMPNFQHPICSTSISADLSQ